MASPTYIRNGYVYAPALEVNVQGLVGGPFVDVTSNFALAPAGTGALILDRLIIPARCFDAAGQYVRIYAQAVVVNNANTKTLTINWGGTGAVGSAPTGGTTVATVAGTTVTGLLVEGIVMKTGTSTQDLMQVVAQQGTTISAPAVATATESEAANIQLNLVVNAATAASDITSVRWIVNFGM